jgi:SPP1 family predicted phage head-tail adaptor
MTAGAIGALRHRLTIEAPQRTAGDGGTATITWTAVAEVFARIEAVTGREIEVADGIAGRISHVILIRWRADIEPAMRFTEGTRHFAIRAALDRDGLRRWLTCLCEEQRP